MSHRLHWPVANAARMLLRLPGATEFRRGVTLLVGGTAAAQAIVIATAPLLTRLYTPAQLGVYGVAAAIVTIFVTVACLRYEFAIALPRGDVAAANVLALSLLVVGGFSLAAAAALLVWGPALFDLVGAPGLSRFVELVALAQFAGGVISIFSCWALRTRTYEEIAANRLTQSGTMVFVQLAAGALRAGTFGLLLGLVAGSVAGSSRLAFVAWRGHARAFRRVSWRGIRWAARRFRRFPAFAAPSALLNTVGLEAPLIILVVLYGTATGGQFALAQRICGLPVTLVAAAVGQVYFAQTAQQAREHANELLCGGFGRTTRDLARKAIVPFALLAVSAPILAAPVFGEQWHEAGLFVATLAPMYYLQLVTSPTASALMILERQDLSLTREILRLLLVGGAVGVAMTAHLSGSGAVLSLSIAGCLVYLVYGLTTWRAVVAHDAAIGCTDGHCPPGASPETPAALPLAPPDLPAAPLRARPARRKRRP